jgi:hypothetical protein
MSLASGSGLEPCVRTLLIELISTAKEQGSHRKKAAKAARMESR